MKIFCLGDNSNIECPYCGRINHNVCAGKNIPFERKIFKFQAPCFYCGQEIFYTASWEIRTIAEKS